jgi:hypothetical protein
MVKVNSDAQMPFNIEAPELFPGLTVPMHFFRFYSG